MESMLRCFSRIVTYAIVLSCCVVAYSCNKNESQSNKTTDYLNGHDYVDLGLSVKWATCNVGASLPEEYGDYYAYGEIRTKSTYSEDSCTTLGENMGDIAGNPNYDAARANWGGTWRLPTKKEIQELIENCITEWTTHNGIKGMLVKSKKNGNSIFLPAAGYCDESSLYYAGESGYYWSASPDKSSTQYACGLFFTSDYFVEGCGSRYYGRNVRPVIK